MTLRVRIAIAVALAVALAVIATGGATLLQARRTLRGELDRSLRERANEVQFRVRVDALYGTPFVVPDPGAGAARSLVQLVDPSGRVRPAEGQPVTIPVEIEAQEVAAGVRGAFFADLEIEGIPFRVYTAPTDQTIALQVAMPLAPINDPLRRLVTILISVSLLGIVLAAMAGIAIARAVTRPVERLTETAETVARTRDLSQRIQTASHDELGRLAEAFNTMLIALDDSVSAQRQLVADASHELRTPIASLRTNIEVLARGFKDAPEDLRLILEDLVAQSAALSRLIADLLDLARDPDPSRSFEPVQLDEVVDGAVATLRAIFPNARFEVETQPITVSGIPTRIERAVTNLLENAAKWNPEDGEPIRVELSANGSLTVTDHGPGVPREHREKIFERFWRSPDARGTAGSGLGLAIVRRIAKDHGGTAYVEDAPGGGACFVLNLPVATPTDAAG
ncbi:MAG: sensor histidine kinase [Actinomycetota bacterium]